MGDVIEPRPPQWVRRERPEEESSDGVIELLGRLTKELNVDITTTAGVTPTIVQLAALRLVQKAVILNYQRCVGAAETTETLKQARDLAAQYRINGIEDDQT